MRWSLWGLDFWLRSALEPSIPPENIPILEALERCLDVRDKYMLVSGQKLGFNPRDHDGLFTGLDDDLSTVSGVRPEVDWESRPPPRNVFKKWRIYPRPPPPHWHWHGKDTVAPSNAGYETLPDEEFDFDTCEIPGPHQLDFSIDERGVYQVYDPAAGECDLSHGMRA